MILRPHLKDFVESAVRSFKYDPLEVRLLCGSNVNGFSGTYADTVDVELFDAVFLVDVIDPESGILALFNTCCGVFAFTEAARSGIDDDHIAAGLLEKIREIIAVEHGFSSACQDKHRAVKAEVEIFALELKSVLARYLDIFFMRSVCTAPVHSVIEHDGMFLVLGTAVASRPLIGRSADKHFGVLLFSNTPNVYPHEYETAERYEYDDRGDKKYYLYGRHNPALTSLKIFVSSTRPSEISFPR